MSEGAGTAPAPGTSGQPAPPTSTPSVPVSPEQKWAPKLPKGVAENAATADELLRQQALARQEAQDGVTPDEGDTPPSQPAAPVQAPPQAGEDTWEQRARSALGRLESATSTLNQQNQRIVHLEGLLASMQATKPTQQEATPVEPLALVSQEERDEWGEPMLDMIGKRAQEAIHPEINELRSSLASIQNQLQGVGSVIARNETKTVYQTLDDAVTNWRQINRTEEFKDWANQIEPYSGIPRATLIRQAFDRHEGDRIVTFFKGYLSEAAALDPGKPQPGSGTAPSPNGQAGNGKIPLETFTAPGRARSAPPETPPEKPLYTRAWISQFWASKLKGAYKGREAEADAVERDIFLAGNEGRIR